MTGHGPPDGMLSGKRRRDEGDPRTGRPTPPGKDPVAGPDPRYAPPQDPRKNGLDVSPMLHRAATVFRETLQPPSRNTTRQT